MNEEQKMDVVNHPVHYEKHKIVLEPIDIIETLPFSLGNVIKYIVRADDKGNKLQDLEKSRWYLKRFIDKSSLYSPAKKNEFKILLSVLKYSNNRILRIFGDFLSCSECDLDFSLSELFLAIELEISKTKEADSFQTLNKLATIT